MYDETNTLPAEEPVQPAGSSTPFSSAPASDYAAGASTAPGGMPGSAYGSVPGSVPGSIPGGVPGSTGVPPTNLPPAEPPVPALAGLLGLIPGVGAMYNGQFAKGLAHLAIFAVLVSLADHVNGIFGIFVAGWVCYQAFEAYHTARARRDGLPLPNAFGLNDIGERLGFGKNWPGATASAYTPYNAPPSTASAWAGANYPPQTAPAAAPVPPPPAAAYPAGAYASPTVANWVGYVPPTAFATAQTPSPEVFQTVPVPPASASGASWSATPYAETLGPTTASFATDAPVPTGRRFPIGAVLLIALGGIFLLSNVAPAWRFGERWLLPLLLAAAAVWIFVRRLGAQRGSSFPAGGGLRRDQLICALRLPLLLLVLAVMFTLQTAGWLTIAQTWPLLLISLGGLLLLERTLGRVSLRDSYAATGTAGTAATNPDTARGEAV